MFIILQAAFLCYALAFAHFQVPVVRAMIDYVPLNNPYTKPFHNRGAVLSGLIAAAFILFAVCNSQITILEGLLLAASFYGIYKIAFDGYIGASVYEDFFYLGTTSKQDNWFNNVFSFTGPGEAKVIVCAVVVIGVNVIKAVLL